MHVVNVQEVRRIILGGISSMVCPKMGEWFNFWGDAKFRGHVGDAPMCTHAKLSYWDPITVHFGLRTSPP